MTDRPRGFSASGAEGIYRAFRKRLEEDPRADIEEIVAAHPQHEDALRLLHFAHEEDGDLDEDAEELHARLRADLALESSIQARTASAEKVDPTLGIPSASGRRRYTPRREIARGGMGRILEVYDEDLDRTLAMKVVREARGDSRSRTGSTPAISASLLRRFINEARLTARIDHPGVVPVHEIGVDDRGRVFFTMPLVVGQDLQSIIDLVQRGEEGWTQTRVLNALVRICETVSYAHSKGIIHRDLKPANIMVGPFGETYVMDWGLAKALGRAEKSAEASPGDGGAEGSSPDSSLLTIDGAVLGTPSFMSPEQARGPVADLDPRSDVYSLGAILYTTLSGYPPYLGPGDSASSRQILDAVAAGPPRPIHTLRRDVPAELIAICEKAMARDRAERYESTERLTEDLRAYLENRVVRAHRTGPTAELRKWVSRNRSAAISALAALVLVLAGLTTFILWQEEARQDLALAGKQKDQALEAQAAALRRAQGHRLTAQSSALRGDNPTLALLLAIEGAQRAPGLTANNALLAALDSLRETRCVYFESRVGDARLSPDGRYLALAVGDRTVRIWDLVAERQARALVGHDLEVTHLDFHPDGTRVATAGWDGTVRIWDLATGRELEKLLDHQRRGGAILVRKPRFSPDGSQLVCACRDDRTVWIFGLEGGSSLKVELSSDLIGAGFTPDGHGVLTSTIRSLDLWSAHDGRLLASIPAKRYSFTYAEFEPSGERVAAVCSDRRIRVFPGFSGGEELVIPSNALNVRFSRDGGRLIGWGSKEAQVFDSRTGELLERLRGHGARISSGLFRQDARSLVTTSLDGTVRFWRDSPTSGLSGLEPAANTPLRPFSPDGSRVVTCIDGWVARVWDVTTGSPIVDLAGHQGEVLTASFSPDGARIVTASGDGTAMIWNSRTGEPIHVLRGHDWVVRAATFSPDGRFVATASHDMTARTWDAVTGSPFQVFEGHRNWVLSASFDPDGESLLTSAIDGVRIWDAATGQQRTKLGEPSSTPWASFSSDGSRIVAGMRARTVIMDAETGQVVNGLSERLGFLHQVFFSPQGELVVTLGEDQLVRVWSAKTGDEIATLPSPEGGFRFATFDSRGTHVLTVTADGAVRAWPLDPLSVALESKPRELTPSELDAYEIGTPEERESRRRRFTRALYRETVASLEATAEHDPLDFRKWVALAEAHSRLEDSAAEVECLERAVRSPGAPRSLLARLRRSRERALPELVSYSSIDSVLAAGPSEREDLQEFKNHLARESLEPDLRAVYVEARELQLRGEAGAALPRFEALTAADPSHPEPWMRGAECLIALGRITEGKKRLEKAIESGVDGGDLLWEAWFRLNVALLRRTPAKLLAEWPVAREKSSSSVGDDLAWALREIDERGAIRLNCGGAGYDDAHGRLWGGDRFFSGGRPYVSDSCADARAPFPGQVRGTAEETVYRTWRRFDGDTIRPPGYRIPLTAGVFRITLHLAELESSDSGRAFAVRLEGADALEECRPARLGFATATTEEHTIRVEDGYLDLELVPRSGDPALCGIEIEPDSRPEAGK